MCAKKEKNGYNFNHSLQIEPRTSSILSFMILFLIIVVWIYPYLHLMRQYGVKEHKSK